ncbi:hypothetical protein TNCV_635361 [Trichonephila clavipes]|nr:hypothetical protein TNCV_635361 [Trichonephila clavipes]
MTEERCSEQDIGCPKKRYTKWCNIHVWQHSRSKMASPQEKTHDVEGFSKLKSIRTVQLGHYHTGIWKDGENIVYQFLFRNSLIEGSNNRGHSGCFDPATLHRTGPEMSYRLDVGERLLVSSRAALSIGCLGRAPRGPDKLHLTTFSGCNFRSSSAEGACRSSAPRAQNELKSSQEQDEVPPDAGDLKTSLETSVWKQSICVRRSRAPKGICMRLLLLRSFETQSENKNST